MLFGVGSGARSASKSAPSPRIATHCVDELIVCPTRVTIGSRLGVQSQADSHGVAEHGLQRSVFYQAKPRITEATSKRVSMSEYDDFTGRIVAHGFRSGFAFADITQLSWLLDGRMNGRRYPWIPKVTGSGKWTSEPDAFLEQTDDAGVGRHEADREVSIVADPDAYEECKRIACLQELETFRNATRSRRTTTVEDMSKPPQGLFRGAMKVEKGRDHAAVPQTISQRIAQCRDCHR
jgi:hypothetical protein